MMHIKSVPAGDISGFVFAKYLVPAKAVLKTDHLSSGIRDTASVATLWPDSLDAVTRSS